jgi:cytidine deaminase
MAEAALTAIAQIREARRKTTGHENYAKPRTVYILDSIKHKEEVLTFRKIYGQAFHLISVYTPRNLRKDNLAKRIAKSHGNSSSEAYFAEAERLITRDYDEMGEGQKTAEMPHK